MKNHYSKKTIIYGVKQLTLIIGLLLESLSASAQAPDFAWAKQAQSYASAPADVTTFSTGIAHDNQGNSYITGYFNGSVTFGSTTLTSSSGSTDVFVAKFDAAGNVLWAQKAGGTGNEQAANSIAVDGSGNSYITGSFQGSATFGSTTLTSSGLGDVFVAKYDAAGNLLWAQKAGGTGNEQANSIAVDGSGNSYITGSFGDNATFGSTTFTTTPYNGPGIVNAINYDIFVAKFDAAGNVLWAKQSGGSVSDTGYGIAVDGSGNSYVTGYFDGSATFGSTTLTSIGGYDVFVAKYDATGNVLWAIRAGGANFDYATSIAVDGSGNSYVTGSFKSSAIFGCTMLTNTSGSLDIFVVKYDAAGNVLWAKKAGGSGYDVANSIALDCSGNSYVTGRFDGSATFGSTTLTSNSGSINVFVTKYDAAGNVLWAIRSGGNSSEEATSIAVDGSGNSYVTDYFAVSATFGSTTLTTTTGGSADREAFIAKINADQYTLITAVTGSGTVAKNPNQSSYQNGSTVQLTATPDPGFQFSGWSGDATGTTNPLTVTMNENKNITATFTAIPAQYNLNVTVNGSGTVSKSPDQATYTWGSTVSLTATPAAGFQFSGWSGDATGIVNWLIVPMNSNKSITATFTPATTQYSLNLTTSGSGTVAKNPNQTSYTNGSTVTLTATPDPGFQFSGWSGDATGTTNPLTVTMNGNKNITATFTAVPVVGVTGFNLMNAISSQAIQPLVSGAVLNLATLPNRKLNIRALTNPNLVGSVVFNLSGQQTKTRTDAIGPHYSLQGDNNGDYFSWIPPVGTYTLTARTYSGSNGTGTPGVQQTITFTVIDQVNPVLYNLNITASGSGTISSNPNQTTYASGSTVSLTATPAAGYQFSGWSGDATGTTNPLTVTMNGNKNIMATFTTAPAVGVTGFNLMNAISSQAIQPLVSGDVINLATLPNRKVNIRALTNPSTVGSVVFNLSGQQTKTRTDAIGPHYSLQGDNNGDYFSWIPPVGTYTLTAGTYSGSNGSGTPGAQQTITFTVIDDVNAIARTAGTGNDVKELHANEVNVSPNPFTDKLMLELTSDAVAETAKVTLNSIDGKTVYQKEVKLNKGRGQEELNGLSKLPAGMYFLMLQLDEKPIVRKVMKQ